MAPKKRKKGGGKPTKPTSKRAPAKAQQATPEPEPEGGPLARQQDFLAQRLAVLRPKGPATPTASRTRASKAVRSAAEPEAAEGQSPLPSDFRLRMVGEYRRHQRAQLPPEKGGAQPPSSAEQPAAESETDAEDDTNRPRSRNRARRSAEIPSRASAERPAAPVPPPANNWVPIGPSVLRQGQGAVQPATSGRTPGIAVAPGGTRIYIGSANGGVWRSDDTGRTWRSLMEAFDLNPTQIASDSLACGAIAIDPANPDRIYVGTGEGSGAAYFGVGPILSIDGGANWVTEQVAPGSAALAGSGFFELAVDPADPDRVVAATAVGVYRREPNGSGGFHWARKAMGGATAQVVTSAVVAETGGVTTFFAARRNGPVFSSNDGDTWTQLGTGFPTGVQRVSLAVQADNPTVVYAFRAGGTVWRLDVADGTWRQITGVPAPANLVGNQGWYDLAIAVAPDNVNRVYLGGSTVLSGGDWSGALYRCEVTVSGTSASMATTYIGASVHADIHRIVFAPGDATRLWVGCDGGVFYSTSPTASGNIFESRNTGLATLTMNYLGQHPTEDAVAFCGTQDNGGVRFTGEEAWLYSSGGDGGFAVVNWTDPYRVLSTYVNGSIRRSTTGGQRYSYTNVNVPLASGEQVLFYAPLVGTPPSGTPADADVVAFGSIRPWISSTFGGGWQSIPNGTLAGDSLNNVISSLVLGSATRLFAGTMSGGVYRFVQAAGTWTRTQLDTIGGASALPLAGPVTDIAIDYADATGDSIYITLGGNGDYRHVWHFDGTQWQQRSGPAAGSVDSLLDVQANAIITDPANTTHVYVAADIGIYRSVDGGATWTVYSEGLPDAAVLDLQLHSGRRIVRAATHGRGVFERTLPDGTRAGVELYIRDTQLDQGRFTTVNGLPDPTAPGEIVRHWRGPDIKLDTPDAGGQYQFPLGSAIDFHEFVDDITDDFRNVATHATATITTRVYVQVHNRGVVPANNVRVMCLLANASAGLPALPEGFDVNVRSGTPITSASWQTIGTATLNDVRPGFPKIAAFNLSSDELPPPANLAGNDHHCVLALVHHADDQFTNTQTHTDTLSMTERKSAHKNLKVVQFTGTLPAPMPAVVVLRINNAWLRQLLETRLQVLLNGYAGRVRVVVPTMRTAGPLERIAEGMRVTSGLKDFERWVDSQRRLLRPDRPARLSFNKEWTRQRLEDIQRALASGAVLEAVDRQQIALRHITLEPNGYHTLFFMFDRPRNARTGSFVPIEFLQVDERSGNVIGGMSTRIEFVPAPKVGKHPVLLSMWTRGARRRRVVHARLQDPTGKPVRPSAETEVLISLQHEDGTQEPIGSMRYHKAWGSYYRRLADEPRAGDTLKATAIVHGARVADVELKRV
jgi:hypothetical protein